MLMRLFVRMSEFQNKNKDPALAIAVEKGLTECVRLLLEAGADTQIKTRVRGGHSYHKT